MIITHVLLTLFVFLPHRYALVMHRLPAQQVGKQLYLTVAASASGFLGAIALLVFFVMYGIRISWTASLVLIVLSMVVTTIITAVVQMHSILFRIFCFVALPLWPVLAIIAFRLISVISSQ